MRLSPVIPGECSDGNVNRPLHVVTLRLTVSQSVCLGVEPALGLWPDFFLLLFFFKFAVFILWGAFSDERSSLSFVNTVCSSQSVFT
jgi:hypothetical protein